LGLGAADRPRDLDRILGRRRPMEELGRGAAAG